MTGSSPRVAIAHDYLTQRGGAERVERICVAATELLNRHWDREVLVSQAGAYPEGAFVDRLRREVALLLERGQPGDRFTFAARTE